VFTIWELTTGFLIMGIPAFPRAFKLIPGSTVVITFFRSLTSKTDVSKSKPWQHMYKPRSRRRRSVFEISELETDGLDTVNSAETEHTMSRERVEVEPKRNVKTQHAETV
jgi:hypothetical protein